MAKTKISEFSATANSNTDINSINIAEGCAPSNINDAIRELMAELKDFQAGTKGDSFNGPVGTSTAAAGAFTTLSSTGNTTLGDSSGDTVTINGTATFANVNPTLSAGTANGVLYLNGSKVLTTGSALTFDGSSMVLNTSTSSNALRITQTGAGNALVVEDSANPDSTPFVVDASGGVIVGNTSTTALNYTSSPRFQVAGTSQATTALSSVYAGSSANLSGSLLFGKSTGTLASPMAVVSGDDLGRIQFEGHDGTAFIPSAQILAEVDGTPGTNDMPGRLVFATTADGASSPSERMRLDSSGNLGLGVTPSAWSGFGKTMEFNNAGCYVGNSGATSMQVGANNYFNGSNYIYSTTNVATRYAQSAGQHIWFTAPSGTAGNAITFTQAMTLDASGNLSLGGTTNKVTGLSGSGSGFTVQAASAPTISVWDTSDASYYLNIGQIQENSYFWNIGNGFLSLGTNNTERARIDSSGNFAVGQTPTTSINQVAGSTVAPSGYMQIQRSAGNPFALARFGSSTGTITEFYYNATTVGTISITASATAYNTSSDYRLKDNPQPLTGSGAFIDALQPKTWNWKADGSKGVGFIAHEAQTVSPSSVTGEKDAVDEDGKPVMQAMEYGSAEFIANIIAELQSLRKRVAQLESKGA